MREEEGPVCHRDLTPPGPVIESRISLDVIWLEALLEKIVEGRGLGTREGRSAHVAYFPQLVLSQVDTVVLELVMVKRE